MQIESKVMVLTKQLPTNGQDSGKMVISKDRESKSVLVMAKMKMIRDSSPPTKEVSNGDLNMEKEYTSGAKIFQSTLAISKMDSWTARADSK